MHWDHRRPDQAFGVVAAIVGTVIIEHRGAVVHHRGFADAHRQQHVGGLDEFGLDTVHIHQLETFRGVGVPFENARRQFGIEVAGFDRDG